MSFGGRILNKGWENEGEIQYKKKDRGKIKEKESKEIKINAEQR